MTSEPGARDRGEATRLLHASSRGACEGGELLALLYEELRRIADAHMAREREDHTLQPTALVHEAWMKLFDREALAFDDRRHFLATAARAMRQILVDHARGKQRAKRGGGWHRVEADAQIADERGEELDLVVLDTALDRLRENAPRQAQVVELRYFGGLSVEETASVLDVSERTVMREWRFAKAWLTRELEA